MKRIISLVLALLMALALMPSVLAEEESAYWQKYDEPITVQMTKVIYSTQLISTKSLEKQRRITAGSVCLRKS